MNTGAKRGRPVSAASREAALRAAVDLLDERGYEGFTVDEVVRRSGVGKATVYSHWRGGFALAVEAYGRFVTDAVPVRDTGDAVKDLRSQIVRLAAFYAGDRGRVAAQLIAAATAHDGGAELVRDRFFAQRRAATVRLVERGKNQGRIRADVDSDLAIDVLFGSVVFRMFNGQGPLRPAQAKRVAALVLAAIV